MARQKSEKPAPKCMYVFANPDSGSASPEGLSEIRSYLKKTLTELKSYYDKNPERLEAKDCANPS